MIGDTIDELLHRLEIAFGAQRRFAASASHELRTPLAMMRTSLDVAIAKPGPVPAELTVLALLCGAALIAISLAWLSQTSVSQGYLGGLFGPLLLFGIGIGLSYVPMGATILKGVDRDDSGSASGMYQAMQQIGGSVGLAILVSIAVGHG